MAKVTNISTGPRGAYNKGVLIMAEPGQTIEADDYVDEWFKSAGKGASVGEADPAKPLSKMNATELEAAAAKLDPPLTVAQDADGKDIPFAEATNKQKIAALEAAQAKA